MMNESLEIREVVLTETNVFGTHYLESVIVC
jgi:hypothetical protein